MTGREYDRFRGDPPPDADGVFGPRQWVHFWAQAEDRLTG